MSTGVSKNRIELTLDEKYRLTDYTMSYGGYGGAGCAFSISIRAK